MHADEFKFVIGNMIDRAKAVLLEKNEGYNTNEDKLEGFKKSAALQKTTLRKALGGMMVKHTVSIYDLIESPEHTPMAVWDEKITDHINYLLLLKAVVSEEGLEYNTSDAALAELREKLSSDDYADTTTYENLTQKQVLNDLGV